MKGIASITGTPTPLIGQDAYYEVSKLYAGTVISDYSKIKWKVFRESNGHWVELKGTIKTGKKVKFNFPQKWYGKRLLIEAFISNPEKKSPPGFIVKPVLGPKKIRQIQLRDANGNPLAQKPKYGQNITAQIYTENMLGDTLNLSLWERDTMSSDGHDTSGNTKLWSGTVKVTQTNGIAKKKILLSPSMMTLANKSMFEGGEHEYYMVVQADNTRSKYSGEVPVSNEIILSPAPSKPATKPATKAKPAQPEPPSKGFWEQLKVNVINALGLDEMPATGKTATTVNQNKGDFKCTCKEYNLSWGDLVTCEFRKRVVKLALGLGLPSKDYDGANWLMAVMALETGRTFSPTCGTFKKHKDDTKNGYVGLIQIGKVAAIDLGVKRSDLIKLTAEEQLVYVEKFFRQKKFAGKLKTKTDLYLAVNYPAACGHGTERDYVVYDSNKAAYDDNPMFKKESHEFYFDKNKKKQFYEGREGKSYVWEFEQAINDFYEEGKGHLASNFTCKPLQKVNVDTKDLVTYYIYNDGRLEKHIPKEIKKGFETKYKYMYLDPKDDLHDLGTYTFHKTQVYNGKKGTFVNLINLVDVTKEYNNGGYHFKFNIDSPRSYVNEKTLASFFGAMMEVNYQDISCNGFSHKDGSSKPSVSHINGNNGDFKYLRTDKKLMFGDGTSLDISANPALLDAARQNSWNNALYKFGWKSMLGWSYKKDGKTKNLSHIPKNTKNHHHHLHLQGYTPNFKEVKK